MLSKEAIVGAKDLPREKANVPEWGGDVLVRGLTSAERDAYMDAHVRIEGMAGGRPTVTIANSEALLVAKCLIKEDGSRLFKDSDAPLLAEKSGAVVHRLCDIAERISGLGADDLKAMEKNSEAPQGVDSASD